MRLIKTLFLALVAIPFFSLQPIDFNSYKNTLDKFLRSNDVKINKEKEKFKTLVKKIIG